MSTARLRSKRVIIPAAATLAVLAVGGTVWTASADQDVRGDERDRVAAAAVDAAGGGTATEVESSDDTGEAYEVEVRLDDGTEVDVTLDDQLAPVVVERDDQDDQDDDSDRDDAAEGDTDRDDRVVTDAERTDAERAALTAVPGTVLDVEASDDRGVAYDVEVRDTDGHEWDIELDTDFNVVSSSRDR